MTKTPIVLFRKTLQEEGEFETCSKHLNTTEYRTEVPPESLVIGRYSVLPYYRELEAELALNGSRLINSWEEHQFLADIVQVSRALGDLTPKTYTRWNNLPEGAYVLKGKTNSRKHHWETHMFAPTLKDIPRVAKNLMNDTMINEQGIVVREYHELLKISEGINGLPITNEWRFFILYGNIAAYGYYWASDLDAAESEKATIGNEGFFLVGKVMEILADMPFYVIDVAQKADGSWIVVELNDGQMSGLSMIEPSVLYERMAQILNDPTP